MIIEVKKEVETFFKDTKSFGGYKYVSGSQVLERITPKMNELGLLFIPSSAKHTGWERHEYKTAAGKDALDFIVQGDLTYRFVNANDPKDFYEIPFVYYGQQDDISKSFGSALTYSERYFLLKYFGLPTDEDDPDGKDTTGKKTKGAKALSEAQIKRLFALGKAAGYQSVSVIDQIQKKFKKEPDQLTKLEYDQVCKGYEAKANENK